MLCVAPGAHALQGPLDITGRWQADTPDGPQVVIVHPDSTASFGEETVRWRIAGDTVYILFGDEWVGYNFLLDGDSLILSGGDLEEPITLTRVDASPAAPAALGGHAISAIIRSRPVVDRGTRRHR